MKTNTENQQEATGAEVEQKKEETSVPRGTQEKTRVTERQMQITIKMLNAFEGNPKILTIYKRMVEADENITSKNAFAAAVAIVTQLTIN